MKRNIVKLSLLLFMLLALVGAASADVFRFMGTGNWEDSTWRNQTLGANNVAPPTKDDAVQINWSGQTATLNSHATIGQLLVGQGEAGNLILAPNSSLYSEAGWSSIGRNAVGTLTVGNNALMTFGNHFWGGFDAAGVGTITINGGTVVIENATELGGHDFGDPSGGTCNIIVNDGTLHLDFIHDKTFMAGSTINLTGTSKLTVNRGDEITRLTQFITDGKIIANGGAGTLELDYDVSFPGLTTIRVVGAGASFGIDKPNYLYGEEIGINWGNQPGNAKDWVAIYEASSPATGVAGAIGWAYTDGTVDGTVATPTGSLIAGETFIANEGTVWPIPAGDYKAYFFLNDGYTKAGPGVPFTVEVPPPPPVLLSVNMATILEGQTPEFIFSGQPGNELDWIGVWTAGSAATDDTGLVGRVYADGIVSGLHATSAGSVKLAAALPAGDYEAYFCVNDTYVKTGPAVAFTKIAVGAEITATTWQEVKDANPGVGGIVLLTAGTYVADSRLDPREGVTYRGVGDATIIDAATNGPDDYLFQFGEKDNMIFESFKVINCTTTKGIMRAWKVGGRPFEPQYITFKNLTFDGTGTTLDNDGGVLQFRVGALDVIDCTFENLENTKHGVCIQVGSNDNPAYLYVTGSTFTNCKTSVNNKDGGAFRIAGKDTVATITDCVFTDVISGDDAGAIKGNDGGTINIINSAFTNVRAEKDDGGAILIEVGATLNIVGSTFTNVSSKDDGGVFQSIGGGILNITDSTFTDCDGEDGGVIFIDGEDLELNITGTEFTNSKGSEDGGAIYVANTGTVTIDDCVFDGSSAGERGGHMDIRGDSSVFISNSKFLNGTAVGNSAAFRMTNDNSVESHITNCLFAGNVTAGPNIVQLKGRDIIEAVNNTFINNTSGSNSILRLVHFYDVSTPIICSSNIFSANTITTGGGGDTIGVVASYQTTGTAAVDFTVTNNLFFDNVTTFPLVGGSDLDGGLSITETGRLTGDPQLDPTTFRPWATSPATNGSDPTYATTTDIDGLPAVGVRDIGAYERVPGPQIATDGGTALVIPELWLRNATSAFLTLKVWNAGDEDLTIDAATFTETGFVAITSPTLVTYPLTLKPLIDNPNEIQDYQVGFDTGLLLNGSSSGDFSDTLSITGNSPISFPVSVYVKASNPLASVNSWMLYED